MAALLGACPGKGGGEDAPAGPALLLVTVDDLRADLLPGAGPAAIAPERAPHLARLLEEGLSVTGYVTTSTATNAALATLHTGLPPAASGVRSVARFGRGRLAPARVTLAERLAERGWDTLAAVPLRQLAARFSGLDQGFATWLEEGLAAGGAPLADAEVGARFRAALAPRLAAGGALLGWLHLGGQREGAELAPERLLPFLVRALEPFRAESPELAAALAGAPAPGLEAGAVAELRALVARRRGSEPWRALRLAEAHARVAELDRELGELWRVLGAAGREEAWIVLAGTRGAYLDEPRPDGPAEGFSEGLLRTPLVLRLPGALAPGRAELLAGGTVLVPTLLAALGGGDAPLAGLGPGLQALLAAGTRDAVVGVDSPRAEAAALLTERWKLVPLADGTPLVLSRAGDVALDEGDPVALEDAEARAELERLLALPRPREQLRLVLRAGADLADVELVVRAARPELRAARADPGLEARLSAARVLELRLAALAAGEERAVVVATRDADVPLELELRIGGRAPGADQLRFVPGSLARVPRLPPRASEPWPPPTEGPAPWLVDVARASDRGWRVAVGAGDAPQGSRARLWLLEHPPPEEPRVWSARGEGLRVASEPGLPGALVVEGPLPLELALGPTAGELALAAEVDGAPVPAELVRYLGRRFAPAPGSRAAGHAREASGLRLALPPWLPARPDWLSAELPAEPPVVENGAPTPTVELTVELAREVGTDFPAGPLGLGPEELRFLQRLGNSE